MPLVRDSRKEQIERWANYVLTNPDWKKHHTAFINAIFDKANETIKKLVNQPGGPEKIAQLYNIKNRKGYPSIFKD